MTDKRNGRGLTPCETLILEAGGFMALAESIAQLLRSSSDEEGTVASGRCERCGAALAAAWSVYDPATGKTYEVAPGSERAVRIASGEVSKANPDFWIHRVRYCAAVTRQSRSFQGQDLEPFSSLGHTKAGTPVRKLWIQEGAMISPGEAALAVNAKRSYDANRAAPSPKPIEPLPIAAMQLRSPSPVSEFKFNFISPAL